MKNVLAAIFCALLLLGSQQVQAQTPPTGFTSTVVSTGWNEAVGLTFSSSGKMFVWERPGKVWVVVNGQRQLVLDISAEVGGWEDHGLLGLALDPNFDSNGYLYLLYVVDRHYLINFGTAAYSATTNDYYSATIGRVTRYTATPAGTGYTVSPASRKILLGATKSTGIPCTFTGHCVGSLVIGADGTLLVSTGDGAYPSQDDGSYPLTYFAQALADGIIRPKEDVGALRAQLVDCLSGKILRLDPATGAGVPSNPFYDAANPSAPRSRVWAMGFRSPFRMSVRPGTGSPDLTAGNPGVLYVGDVGASTWEEIDVVDRPRQNMGWPLYEGLTTHDIFINLNSENFDAPNPLNGTAGCNQPYFYFRNLLKQATPTGTAAFANPCNAAQAIAASVPTFVQTRPLLDWNHAAGGPSRTGTFSGSTATTANIGAAGSPVSGPQFGGNAAVGGVFYPYADFPAGYQNSYFFGDYAAGWVRNLAVNGSNQPSAVANFVNSGAVPVAFGVSPTETGLFYVNFFPSEIRKISYQSSNTPPVAVASSNKTFGPSPLAVQFTGSGSSDPGGSALTYRWNFGDGTPASTAANPSHTFTAPTSAPTNYTVTLTVTNGLGLSSTAQLTISANNTPPQVTITSPAAGTLYPLSGNTQYNLRATVTDAEHRASQLTYAWQTILHHQNHEHPEPVDTARQTSTTIQPLGCGAETYYYRILLTVTDAGGLATTREVRLDPDCSAAGFTLVNADTDLDIQPLVTGAVLNLATLPTRNLNIRANANPTTTGSVVFSLTGAASRSQTENVPPYALFSDSGGNYNPWTPPVGNYALVATPYSGASGTGTAGTPLTVNFGVVDGGGTPGPFTITTATVGSGSVAQSPNAASYASGSVVSLTATPAAGFAFTGWSGDASGTANPLSVTMTANRAITATFTATGGGGAFSFYRAVNLNGPAITLDGNAWGGSTAANYSTNGSAFENQAVPLLPATDATRASMLRQCVFGPSLSVTLSAVPAGTYQAYLYVWEDSGPEIINLSLNGQARLTSYSTGPAGTWARLGPYSVTLVATGTVQFASTGGWPNFSGMELWQQTGGTPGPFTLTTATVGSGSVARSPNAASYASGSVVSLTATPAAGFAFSGWSGDASGTANPLSVTMTANRAITATFTATGGGQQVSSFTLVNADTDLDLQALPTGSVLNLATLPTSNLNIRANTSPVTVGSVAFGLSGAQTLDHLENVVPYALFSDSNGDYSPWTPAVGTYTLVATPYAAAGGGGPAGTALTITFSVINQAGRPAAAPGQMAPAASPVAYPNPSPDGRFAVRLPAGFGGAVRYRLVSALGATLDVGTLSAGAAPLLDFSRAMPATGLYYLLLETPRHTARLKLLRD